MLFKCATKAQRCHGNWHCAVMETNASFARFTPVLHTIWCCAPDTVFFFCCFFFTENVLLSAILRHLLPACKYSIPKN